MLNFDVRADVDTHLRLYYKARRGPCQVLTSFVFQFHKGDGEFGWLGRGDNSKNYWGGANRGSRKCSCGQDKRCGGEDGQSSMMSRYLFFIFHIWIPILIRIRTANQMIT